MNPSSSTTALFNESGAISAIVLGATEQHVPSQGIKSLRGAVGMKVEGPGLSRDMPRNHRSLNDLITTDEGVRRLYSMTGKIDAPYCAFMIESGTHPSKKVTKLRHELSGPGEGQIYSSSWDDTAMVLSAWHVQTEIEKMKAFLKEGMEKGFAFWFSAPSAITGKRLSLVIVCPSLLTVDQHDQFAENAEASRSESNLKQVTAERITPSRQPRPVSYRVKV